MEARQGECLLADPGLVDRRIAILERNRGKSNFYARQSRRLIAARRHHLPEMTMQPQKKKITFVEGLVAAFCGIVIYVALSPFTAPPYRPRSLYLSNMKQVGIAFILYQEANDGQFPTDDPAKKPIEGTPPLPRDLDVIRPYSPYWLTAIRPFLKDESLFRCPQDTSRAPKEPKNVNAVFEYSSSYAINGWTEYQLNISDVANPADWIFLAERNNVARPPDKSWSFYFWTWQGTNPLVWPPTLSPDPTPQAWTDLALTQHNGRPVWAYGDGHVNTKKLSELWKPGKENAFWPARD